jgi:uridine kinase
LTNALNFDHPRYRFRVAGAHLKELREQKTIQQPFILLSLITEQKTPLKVMIVEGILILANPELRDL